jgi:hypothetical protein
MTTPEGRIEKHLVDRVRETNGQVRKLKWIGRNGAPDRMIWWQIHPNFSADIYFVELKRPKGKASRQQAEEHDKMRRSGLHVFVLDTIEKIDAFVKANSYR